MYDSAPKADISRPAPFTYFRIFIYRSSNATSHDADFSLQSFFKHAGHTDILMLGAGAVAKASFYRGAPLSPHDKLQGATLASSTYHF